MILRKAGPLLCLMFALMDVVLANDQNQIATLVRPPSSNDRISGLSFKSTNLPVVMTPKGLGLEPKAKIEATFERPEWNIIWNKKWLTKELLVGEKTPKKVPIIFEVPLKGDSTVVELSAIGPIGELESETLIIRLEASKSLIEESLKKPKKRSYFFTSLGPSYSSYWEKGIETYKMVALTAKASYQFLLFPPKWDLAFSGYINALPLYKTTPTTARFLGLNLRFGYVVQRIKAPWRLSILFGWYYTSLLTSNNSFGYKNMVWPQFFPVITRELKTGDVVTLNIKFAPMLDGFSFVGLSSHELAMGAGFQHFLNSGHPISLNMDFSNTNINVAAKNVAIKTSSFSLSAGYGF